MADGVCIEGTGRNKIDNSSVQNNCELISVKKTYSVSGEQCVSVSEGVYRAPGDEMDIKSLVAQQPPMQTRTEHVDFSDFKSLQEMEDCRKKRCADRYDSSESSDSGVATLSCTDSSTASSDIVDPGSPYSPSSTSSCEEPTSTTNSAPFALIGAPPHAQMPPVPASQDAPAWLWNNVETKSQGTLKRPNGNVDTSSKRIKTESKLGAVPPLVPRSVGRFGDGVKSMNNNKVSITEQQKQNTRTAQHCCPPKGNAMTRQAKAPTEKPTDVTTTTEDKGKPQGKITQYFKSQIKPLAGLKKELNNLVANCNNPKDNNLNKYLTMLSQAVTPKANLVDKRSPQVFEKLCRNIDVRTLTVSSPLKRHMERKPSRKVSSAISYSKKSVQLVREPKKPVHIAPRGDPKRLAPPIAPKTVETKKHKGDLSVAMGNASGGTNPLGKAVVAMPQATVVLTAIRIPQQTPGQTNSTLKAHGSPTKLTGPMIQFPMVHHNMNGAMVQLPNILAKLPHNVLVNPQMSNFNGSHQVFMNGTVIKLNPPNMQSSDVNAPISNGGITMHLTKSNCSMTPKQVPTITVSQQNFHSVNSGVQTIAVSQQSFPTVSLGHPVFMTSPGIFLNTGLPTVITSQLSTNMNGIPHMTSQQTNTILHTSHTNTHINQAIPALNSFNTYLQSTPKQYHITPIPATASTSTEAPFQTANTTVPVPCSVQTKDNATVTCSVQQKENITVPCSVQIKENITVPCSVQIKENITVPSSVQIKEGTTAPTIVQIKESTTVPCSVQINENTVAPCRVQINETLPPLQPPTTSLSIDTALPTIPALLHRSKSKTPSIDVNLLKSPHGSLLVTPKSLVLERIQQKKPNILDLSEISKSIKSNDLEQLSLSVNVTSYNDLHAVQAQKSPILSQPKTIRFPAAHNGAHFGPKGTRRSDSLNVTGQCYWDKCLAHYETSSVLLEHLQTQHVAPQAGPYSCLWNGCKVRARESCSRRWLERHILAHGGTKPLKCIVGGCGCRFSSQLALQRHVNSHFNAEGASNGSKKSQETAGAPKLIRRNGKKLRYRRQPWSARMFDFFDAGVMEGLQHRLLLTEMVTQGPNGGVTLTARQIARRTTSAGAQILVSWDPPNIVQDEWISEIEFTKTRTVNIRDLPSPAACALNDTLSAVQPRTIKHRRKPAKR